jgi:hypothetical protein
MHFAKNGKLSGKVFTLFAAGALAEGVWTVAEAPSVSESS